MTASTPPGEPDRDAGELPELVELEAALADMVGVLRSRAALLRELKEASRDSRMRAETTTTIETEADVATLEVELAADVRVHADRLRPVAQGLAETAPEFVHAVTRFDSAVRSLVGRVSGAALPGPQRSEADEALDGVLQLLVALSVRPWAETAAGASRDYGNPDLRAVHAQLTSALQVFDEQHDVLLSLDEPIQSLPGRQRPQGVPRPGRPTTAPELLAAESAADRWFDSLRLWTEAAHDFRIATEAATKQTAGLPGPTDPAAALRRLGTAMTSSTDRLQAAATDYAERLTDLDEAARVLLARMTSGELSEADRRGAASLFGGLRKFAEGMIGTVDDSLRPGMPDLGDLGGPEISGSIAAMSNTFELVQAHDSVIASWLRLPAEASPSST